MPPPAEGLASRLIVGPTLRTQSDGRLVALVRAGYETAFEEIVRRYGRPLSRYAAAIVGGGSEDVTQDAFSKAHLALCRNDAEIELRPWLFRIVRNTALNHLRDRPPAPEVLAEAIAGGRSPAEELEQREELAELMRRLQALPEPQRAAIVMRELEGLSHEEIAAALGLSGGGARQTIYRARCALRDGLGMLVPLPLLKTVLATAAGTDGPGRGRDRNSRRGRSRNCVEGDRGHGPLRRDGRSRGGGAGCPAGEGARGDRPGRGEDASCPQLVGGRGLRRTCNSGSARRPLQTRRRDPGRLARPRRRRLRRRRRPQLALRAHKRVRRRRGLGGRFRIGEHSLGVRQRLGIRG